MAGGARRKKQSLTVAKKLSKLEPSISSDHRLMAKLIEESAQLSPWSCPLRKAMARIEDELLGVG